MQATQTAQDPDDPVPLVGAPHLVDDCTKPERPIRVYSYWGSPLDSVGEDGDYVLEEISGSLIGPKQNGKWPDELVKIEGPVVGKRGCFPRWKTPEESSAIKRFFVRCYKSVFRFLLATKRIASNGL